MGKLNFEYTDLGETLNVKEAKRTLNILEKMGYKDCLVVMRQTYGTDFPPFYAIETKEYFDKCNEEGEFVLISVVEL